MFWLFGLLGVVAFGVGWALHRLREVYRPFAPIFKGPELTTELPLSPETRGIAHNGGDTKEGLELVREHSIDIVEIDVALVNGRLDVVHTPPRRIPVLLVPLVYRSATLNDAWEELPEGIDVYLDMKSRSRRAIEQVAQVLASRTERTIYVGSSDLDGLIQLRSLAPESLTIFYPKTRERLEKLLGDDPLPVRGVSIGPGHLDAALVTRAQDRSLIVWAGVTNDRSVIQRLLEWQVDGIISDDLAVLTALRVNRIGG
ncbi:MAG TPA: glycerophosphodiester phosphodiesterase [Dehalococcoidia bacterium]|nr:glycerophosphodiester phosphodiesterase [Dehalococcoidia bacterium]